MHAAICLPTITTTLPGILEHAGRMIIVGCLADFITRSSTIIDNCPLSRNREKREMDFARVSFTV